MTAAKTKPSTDDKKNTRVPIVDVFAESPQEKTALHPAHNPLVVEIENVPSQAPQAPLPPPMEVVAPQSGQQDEMQPAAEAVQVQAPPIFRPQPEVSAELPSFFQQDLAQQTIQSDTMQDGIGSLQLPVDPMTAPGVIGEVSQVASSQNPKRRIAIILLVLAVVLLVLGGAIWSLRQVFAPVVVPKATPTPLPSIEPIVTPTPVASMSASASVSAALKKEVTIDVLNGTKIAGFAAKNATLLKKQGYSTGKVGNGLPENAGTIMYDPQYESIAKDIQKILADLTFVLKPLAGEKSITVTLGE